MTPSSKTDELDEGVISTALRGKGASAQRAMSSLYDFYAPRVNYSIGWACRACGYFQNVDDVRQEVWRRLLDRDARLLRFYDPTRGKLGPFIRMLANQQAQAAIRSERRQQALAGAKPGIQAEEAEDTEASQFVARMIQGDLFRRLMDRAREELDELDLLVLREIRLKGRKMAPVAAEFGQSKDALYKRNERLKGKLAALARELMSEASPSTYPRVEVLAAVLAAVTAALISINGLEL